MSRMIRFSPPMRVEADRIRNSSNGKVLVLCGSAIVCKLVPRLETSPEITELKDVFKVAGRVLLFRAVVRSLPKVPTAVATAPWNAVLLLDGLVVPAGSRFVWMALVYFRLKFWNA